MRAIYVDRELLRRYGHSKLSKMAAAAILDLFEPDIAPLDPPSPKTPPYRTKHEVSEVDRITRQRYGHSRILGAHGTPFWGEGEVVGGQR